MVARKRGISSELIKRDPVYDGGMSYDIEYYIVLYIISLSNKERFTLNIVIIVVSRCISKNRLLNCHTVCRVIPNWSNYGGEVGKMALLNF